MYRLDGARHFMRKIESTCDQSQPATAPKCGKRDVNQEEAPNYANNPGNCNVWDWTTYISISPRRRLVKKWTTRKQLLLLQVLRDKEKGQRWSQGWQRSRGNDVGAAEDGSSLSNPTKMAQEAAVSLSHRRRVVRDVCLQFAPGGKHRLLKRFLCR